MKKRIQIFYDCEEDEQSIVFERALLELINNATVVEFKLMDVATWRETGTFFQHNSRYQK